jgi:nucleotide-binding universal stress UspA family protein
MGRVIVGVDGSETAARALERALLEAQRRGDQLTVFRAWLPPVWVGASLGQTYSYDAMSTEISSAKEAKREAAEMAEKALSATGVAVVTDVRVEEGQPGPLLVDASRDADLLVVGTRNRNVLMDGIFGRAATYVTHHATCPVLLVPGGGPTSPYRRVVVGVDGSNQSVAALHWGHRVAQEEGRPLVALHVHSFGRLPHDVEREINDARAWLAGLVTQELGPGAASVELEAGAASARVLQAVGDDDLLVLGARGQGGFAGLHLGSVADQCARHAPCVVAIVRGVTS